jgi:hypothetical protein
MVGWNDTAFGLSWMALIVGVSGVPVGSLTRMNRTNER